MAVEERDEGLCSVGRDLKMRGSGGNVKLLFYQKRSGAPFFGFKGGGCLLLAGRGEKVV
jgi:hypothetical protein